jgi:hypothetical protein
MDKKIKLALSMDQIIQQINAEAELLGFLKVKPTGSHVKKVNKKLLQLVSESPDFNSPFKLVFTAKNMFYSGQF